jgi:hypothetical protein
MAPTLSIRKMAHLDFYVFGTERERKKERKKEIKKERKVLTLYTEDY